MALAASVPAARPSSMWRDTRAIKDKWPFASGGAYMLKMHGTRRDSRKPSSSRMAGAR